ncbi:DUF6480 family protein [Streptomyces sp. NPDC127084]|uniref:DUF6480 family protein n=1 Tax=Streptomyces sp. NPDC127084 TaxID=3347133 RepID=UPI00364C1075
MNSNRPEYNPDPDPARTAGPDGGSTPAGQTPPAESSTSSGAGPYRKPTRGWAKGPLTAISIVVLLFAAFFLVFALVLIF